MSKTVLLTGANGFVGSHIVDTLLSRGDKVKAMIRKTSDQQWLENKPVEICYADLQDGRAMRKALEGVDNVIHNAGVVSCTNRYFYYHHNTQGTRNLLEAVMDVARGIERFVYVSSQAATGPTQGTTPKNEEGEDFPITEYGKSKLLAEQHVWKYRDSLPVSIIRPPAIYGPRDAAFLPYFKMISAGWKLLIGKRRDITLTHAQDLARQIVLQMDHPQAVDSLFYAAPFAPNTIEEFCDNIEKVISADPRRIVVPDKIIRPGYTLSYYIMKSLGIKPPIKLDKIIEFEQSRWTVSGEKAASVLGYEGQMPLMTGIGQTAEWYRWKKWLKTPRDILKDRGYAFPFDKISKDRKYSFDPTCDLCALAMENEIKTRKHYEDDEFIIVDCLICRVPMAVLKDHRASFTEDEKGRLLQIFTELFGDGHHPDFEQRRIPCHAHVHYRSTPHLLPWQRRPD